MPARLIVRCLLAATFSLLVSSAVLAQPVIADFVPKSGVAGQSVTISGVNLGFVVSVLFNGTPAPFTLISFYTIIAQVPQLVTTGPIQLLSAYGIFPSTINYTVTPPTISGFGPRQLAAGTVVAINGSAFTNTTAVTFNGVASPSFTLVSDTLVHAAVPAAATDGRIGVTTFGGGTALSAGTYTRIPGLVSNPWFDTDVAGWLIDRTNWVVPFDTLTTEWSLVDADGRPGSGSIAVINRSNHSGIAPRQCMRVTPGTRYTLGGRLFVAGGQPKTGVAQIGLGWHSGTQCNSYILTSQFGDAFIGRRVGSWNTQFVNGMAPTTAESVSFFLDVWPDAGGATNVWRVLFDNLYFDVERAPSITAVAPQNQLPGAVLTLTGNDFYGVSAVGFNGVNAPTFEVKNATTIVVTIPPAATSGPISVTGPGGTGWSAFFHVIAAPSISFITPTSGYPGTAVTINGNELDSVTAVRFNGVNATYFILSYVGPGLGFAPYIGATVPANATTGPLTVTNARGTASTPFRVIRAAGDLNADSRADITMQSQTTRAVAVWQMNGPTIAAGNVVGTPAASYFVKTISDFDGDGKSDMALQDAATGNVAVWRMNGGTIVTGVLFGSPGAAWELVGSGDINGNGTSDLILQNPTTGDVVLWLTNPAGIVGGAVIGSPGPSYKVVGVADFNNDGRKDILLQNAAGDIAQWQINGLAISNAAVVGNPGAGWIVKGVGDVNNDGSADILLRNSATGDIAEWQMNGLTIVGGFNMGGPGTGFDLMGSADYNGDGYSDVLLRDASGNLAVWLLNGATITSGAVAGSPGADYFPILK